LILAGEGNPQEPGLYVAYVNDLEQPQFRYAKRIFLSWYGGKWYYPGSDQPHRGVVYQWIQVPPLELEE
jgi:hypothetical protein